MEAVFTGLEKALDSVFFRRKPKEDLYLARRLLVEAIKQLGGSLVVDNEVWMDIALQTPYVITTYLDQDIETNQTRILMELSEEPKQQLLDIGALRPLDGG